MVAMQTNCSLFELVTLTKYQNWCGLGDNGEPPKDNNTLSCGVCNHLDNSTVVSKGTKDESFFQIISNFLSWREDPSCTCSSCRCDLQLALCLRKIGHCAPPLFGVPGFIEEKVNNLKDMTLDFVGFVGNGIEQFWIDLK